LLGAGSREDSEAPTIELARPEPQQPKAPTTHEFKTAFQVRNSDGTQGIQTFCVDHKGRLIALVGPPKQFDPSQKAAGSEVQVLDGEGQSISNWPVDFHAQSINVDLRTTFMSPAMP
jgi:hypothetical protein